jgi:hypothetical protein
LFEQEKLERKDYWSVNFLKWWTARFRSSYPLVSTGIYIWKEVNGPRKWLRIYWVSVAFTIPAPVSEKVHVVISVLSGFLWGPEISDRIKQAAVQGRLFHLRKKYPLYLIVSGTT